MPSAWHASTLRTGPNPVESLLLPLQGALEDAAKAKDSRNIRRGKGKMRNRRYTNRKGPLIVYNQDQGISKAFRNLPGVDVLPVTALNLLHVRPGSRPSLLWRHALSPVALSMRQPGLQDCTGRGMLQVQPALRHRGSHRCCRLAWCTHIDLCGRDAELERAGRMHQGDGACADILLPVAAGTWRPPRPFHHLDPGRI